MADDNKVKFELELDPDTVRKAFKQLEDGAEDTGKKVGKNLSDGATKAGDAFGDLGKKLAAVVSIYAGYAFLKDAVKQSADAELAVNQLAGAFYNAGVSVQTNIKSFTAYSDALERTVGVDADVINQNAALLVSLGKLSGQGLKDATKAALDLSAGLNIDVSTAFNLLAKAATGATTGLGKYGIKVSEAIAPHQRLAEAIKLIEGKFEGFAEAKTNTFSGALTLVELAMDNVSKAVGRLVTQSPVVREVLKFIADSFGKLSDALTGLGKSGGDPVGELIKKLINIGIVISQYVLPPIEIFVHASVVGFDAIVAAAQGLIHAYILIEQALFDYVVKPFVDFAAGGIGKIVGVFNKELGAQIADTAKGITTKISDFAGVAAESSGEVFTKSFDNLVASSKNGFDTTISDNANTFLLGLQNAANNAKPILDNFAGENKAAADASGLAWQQYAFTVSESMSSVVSGFEFAAFKLAGSKESMVKAFKQIGESALSGIAGAVGNSFAAFGKALAKGEDAATAFANAFLGAIGGMLVQLGTSYILQGIAASVNPLTPGIGGPLIAAGAALATFGGVLQAIGGSGGGGGGASASGGDSGGGGGVGVVPGGDTSVITPPEDQKPQKPNATVAVNVYGNVLDNRQTGLALAEVLQDAADSQGLQLKTGGAFS